MGALTPEAVGRIDDDTSRMGTAEIAARLRDQLGQRVVAYMLGAADPKQIADYARGARMSDAREQRLREGFKVVRMIETVYSADTAKAWLFGTNLRLDDRSPIELLGEASRASEFTAVRRAARQFASIDG